MSESLMFALLGFLVACLFGTVCASFLWRRAVIVTTRRITGGDKSEIREDSAENSARDQEVAELRSEIAARDAERSHAETSLHKTAEDLRVKLTAAQSDQKAAQTALQAKQDDLTSAQAHINTLETAIQTLVKTTGLGIISTPEMPEPPEPAINGVSKPNETPETGIALETAKPEVTSEPTAPQVAETTRSDQPDDISESDPTIDVTRSLEERIEALKQGQPTH
ncbi:MAG: hypothetical protein COA62_15340 [Rhodobiaceae bacterium]|nr:MAG: hypothetical protein COA62_15340 [Rhodobiaceae bacterium]